MLDQTLTLPEDPEELRSFTARLLADVKAQAVLIEKLRHQLAGHRAHRFGASSETAEQLQLALETSEIAAASMTARMKLPDIEEKDKPKRRPIPDHIPRMEVELSPMRRRRRQQLERRSHRGWRGGPGKNPNSDPRQCRGVGRPAQSLHSRARASR